MISLKEYINQYNYPNTNEGLAANAISLIILKQMDTNHLISGLADMYDYICNQDDIKLFYMDFSVKERIFWKTLYKMYEHGVWCIFDAENNDILQSIDQSDSNKLTKIDIETKREIRKIASQSKVHDSKFNPAAINKIATFTNPSTDEEFIITTNKIPNIAKRIFHASDFKLIDIMIDKINQE